MFHKQYSISVPHVCLLHTPPGKETGAARKCSCQEVKLQKHLGTAAGNTHAAQLRPDALSVAGGALSCSLPVLRYVLGHLCQGDVLNSGTTGSSIPCKCKCCTFMSQSSLSAFLMSSGTGSDISAAPLVLKPLVVVCHSLRKSSIFALRGPT